MHQVTSRSRYVRKNTVVKDADLIVVSKYENGSPSLGGRKFVWNSSACDRCFFFFQAEDGIRDLTVTGVQTCALPICGAARVGGHPLRVYQGDGVGAVLDQRAEPLLALAQRGVGPRALGEVPPQGRARSEERRVGKEGRSRWAPYH